MMLVGLALERAGKAVIVLDCVAVVANEIGRFFDVTERFHAVLADFQAHDGAHVEQSLADQIGRATQDGDSFLPGGVAPAGKGRLGGGNGVDGVLLDALLKVAHDEIGVGRG